ncbi:MAG: ParB/RepB/Spo0J family partition protein [Acidimicrobiales bacterium]
MSDTAIVSIPVIDLQPDPNNVRRQVGDVKELARSIAGVGVVEPLLVTPIDGDDKTFRIVAGHRRHAAAFEAGVTDVPCLVRTLTEAEVIEIQLVENLQRSAITVLEEAGAYLRLCGHGYSARRLAKAVGKPERHVRERLALLELPDAAQTAIDTGQVTLGDARVLLTVKDRPEIIDAVLAEGRSDVGWAVRERVRKAAAEEKRVALVAACEGEGLRVFGDDRPANFTWLAETGMLEKPHSTEPCHAVVVKASFDGAHAVPICTDRKRHSKRGESGLKLPGRADPNEAQRARARNRKRVSAARGAFLAERLTGRLPKPATFSFLVSTILDASNTNQLACAGRLLGLEPAQGVYGEDWLSPMRELVAGSEADRVRTAVALCAAMSEGRISAHDYGAEQADTYLGFLQVLGYEPDPFESEERDLGARRRQAVRDARGGGETDGYGCYSGPPDDSDGPDLPELASTVATEVGPDAA